mmetsp:Transcript_6359/g.12927  ORF Transcript_6359/g.12927 Transcript_6359/m.12927 type:complete len:218 (+) Transcript_6359:230-883(+)
MNERILGIEVARSDPLGDTHPRHELARERPLRLHCKVVQEAFSILASFIIPLACENHFTNLVADETHPVSVWPLNRWPNGVILGGGFLRCVKPNEQAPFPIANEMQYLELKPSSEETARFGSAHHGSLFVRSHVCCMLHILGFSLLHRDPRSFFEPLPCVGNLQAQQRRYPQRAQRPCRTHNYGHHVSRTFDNDAASTIIGSAVLLGGYAVFCNVID